MARKIKCVIFSALILSPLAFGATGSQPGPTHGQLVRELAELESVGYDPQQRTDYPLNVQKAMRLVEQKRACTGSGNKAPCP